MALLCQLSPLLGLGQSESWSGRDCLVLAGGAGERGEVCGETGQSPHQPRPCPPSQRLQPHLHPASPALQAAQQNLLRYSQAALSLVQLRHYCALIGRELQLMKYFHSDDTPALLCHDNPFIPPPPPD